MKKRNIAVLIGAFTIMTAQLFGQAEAQAAPSPRRSIRNTPPPSATPAEPAAPAPKVTYESRKIATADIGDVRLYALGGGITFTAGGVVYRYMPRVGSGDSYSAAEGVSACLALLAELRKAETIEVTFAVQLPDSPADRKDVVLTELTLMIEKLK